MNKFEKPVSKTKEAGDDVDVMEMPEAPTTSEKTEDESVITQLSQERVGEDKKMAELSNEIAGQNKAEQEKQQRKEYVAAGYDLIIANLQAQLDKGGLFKFMTPKGEIQEKIKGLEIKKAQNPDTMMPVWDAVIVEATFTSKSNALLKQLEDLKAQYPLLKDTPEMLDQKEKITRQIKQGPDANNWQQ